MADIVLHPLTALNGSPAYTADNYRHVVNPFLFPSNATAFNCIQGVRDGVTDPMCSLDGLTVTVNPHCGVVAPWSEAGVYTYAITEPMTVNVPDSTGDYKIVVAVYDPSLSHGETPGAWLQSWPASIPDSEINGLVVARVTAGTISDVATRIRQDSTILVKDPSTVYGIPAMNGQRAIVSTTGEEYKVIAGVWRRVDDIQLDPGLWWKDWPGTKYKCSLSGHVASLSIKAIRGPEWKAKAWDKSQLLMLPDYLKPKLVDINIAAVGMEHSAFQVDPSGVYVRPTADITYGTGSWVSASFSWPV